MKNFDRRMIKKSRSNVLLKIKNFILINFIKVYYEIFFMNSKLIQLYLNQTKLIQHYG